MSIQSTRYIDRLDAIYRIESIVDLIISRNYIELERKCFEPDMDLQRFVDSWQQINISNIDMWTNEMLEKQMDKPFFRYSMFDNYCVVDSDDLDDLNEWQIMED